MKLYKEAVEYHKKLLHTDSQTKTVHQCVDYWGNTLHKVEADEKWATEVSSPLVISPSAVPLSTNQEPDIKQSPVKAGLCLWESEKHCLYRFYECVISPPFFTLMISAAMLMAISAGV